MKNLSKVFVLMLLAVGLSAQKFPDSLTFGLKLDVQYSKRYESFVVSPYLNNIEADSALYEYNLNSKFTKMEEYWINYEWIVIPNKTPLGTTYLFKKLGEYER